MVTIYSVSLHFDDIRIRLGSRLFKESLASTYIRPGMRAAVRLPIDAEIYEWPVLLIGLITIAHGTGFTSNSLPHIPVLRVFRLHLLRRAMRLRV